MSIIKHVIIASDGSDLWERDVDPAAAEWLCFVCGAVNPLGGRVEGCFHETGFPVPVVCRVALPGRALTVNEAAKAAGCCEDEFMAPGGLVRAQALAPDAPLPDGWWRDG